MEQRSKFRVPVVLAIAGLDPSGGAGILADARTIAAFDCYPTAAITSITFQNSSGVYGSLHLDRDTLRGQVLPVLSEFPVASVKTGMLATREIVLEVAQIVREHKPYFLVVDPVMISTSGYALMDQTAVSELKSSLLPLAHLVTPNIPEAEKLVGFPITGEAEMSRAAEAIRRLGAQAVLIKGGHLKSAKAGVIDLLDDQGKVNVFRGEWIEGGEFRGTGCTLASAIASCLVKGVTLKESVRQARDFVASAIRAS
jgi:hydroxymethylpyrimidine/phosphomethylpyrimidine kinase